MEKYSVLFNNMDQHYECLLGTLPGIVYTLDEKGHFTYLSDCASDMLGFSREDLLGRHFSYIIHPGDLPSVSRDYILPRFEGVPTGGDRAPKLFDERRSWPRRTTSLQVRLRRKEAQNSTPENVLTCKVNASGQYDDRKHFCGTVGVIYDPADETMKPIKSDRKKNYNAFELLTHALTHVFSNVFTGIYGNLQLIEMQLENPEEFAGNIEAIKQSIENAISLIKKLSRTVMTQDKLVSGNLERLLSDEADELLKEAGATYLCDLCPDLWIPEADPDYTRHILRAIYFHIARMVVPEGCIEIRAHNITESPIALPRIDCPYIHIGFSFHALPEDTTVSATDTIGQFTVFERIASMALSYELLKKVGGQVTAENRGDKYEVHLYLPAVPAAISIVN